VALRTLYRYYPSKYHVFAELLTTQIDTIKLPESRSGSAVAEFMAEACRNMLRHKHLAGAMIISTQAVRAQSKASGYHAMRDVILQVAGVRVPTEDQIQAARLVEQVTFGVLMWTVGGELDTEQAIADVRLACRLLVADVFPEQES
ncbi:TetR/AcrR family transcriptional regulator, partial [Mycobacterium ahvazicum]